MVANSKHGNYLIVSPCRNEEEYMRETLDSVLGQTVLPKLWIIVDDGSTDSTPRILEEYAQRIPWIEIVTRGNRGTRSVGPGVVDAFYAGFETIDPSQFDYVCKLDLDLRLPPMYFEILIDRIQRDDRIATCSGKAYICKDGRLVSERHGDDTSIGASKFYRMERFLAIGGFHRQVMWDGIDCHQCRMRGWVACSWDEPDLRFQHLRPMGSSQKGILTGRFRHGFGQYYMGTGFWYLIASALFRLNERPCVLGSLAMVWGWCWSAMKRQPRYQDREFRRFLNRYQWRVLVFGKKKALQMINSDVGSAVHQF